MCVCAGFVAPQVSDGEAGGVGEAEVIGRVRVLWQDCGDSATASPTAASTGNGASTSTSGVEAEAASASPGSGSSSSDGPRRVWLWSSASAADDVMACLVADPATTVATTAASTDEADEMGGAASEAHMTVDEEATVTLTSLKKQLSRFQLAGPLCHSILQHILRPDLVGTEAHVQRQASVWQQMATLRSPASLSQRVVLGLTVNDPRLLSPCQTNTAPTEGADTNPSVLARLMADWPQEIARSTIWDAGLRASLRKNQVTLQQINERREELLVPGDNLEVQPGDARVPVLLVQRPGCVPSTDDRRRLGYGSGWDLIAPTGWGMGFWLQLVLAGARTIGLTEVRCNSLEVGMPYEPYDYPDTKVPRLCPPICPISLPHFRLYEVVLLHVCVLPYKYRTILEMLPKLMKWCEIMGSRRMHGKRPWMRRRRRTGMRRGHRRTG